MAKKKAVKPKPAKRAPKEAPDWRVLYTGIVNRVADLEVMNDTLFKRTSELAQSIVAVVDAITALNADVVAVKALLEIE